MRSRTSIRSECKVRYEKTGDDGMPRKVTESYVVDALSFSEAESRILEEMGKCVSGELEESDLNIAQYKEMFFADNDLADKWYKAKLAFITIDEKNDKEKKTSVFYLVNAGNINSALKNVDELMGSTMIDYQTCNLTETHIMDVFEYKKKPDTQNESK